MFYNLNIKTIYIYTIIYQILYKLLLLLHSLLPYHIQTSSHIHHMDRYNNCINPDLQTGHRHGIIIAKTKDVPNHVKEGEVKQK